MRVVILLVILLIAGGQGLIKARCRALPGQSLRRRSGGQAAEDHAPAMRASLSPTRCCRSTGWNGEHIQRVLSRQRGIFRQPARALKIPSDGRTAQSANVRAVTMMIRSNRLLSDPARLADGQRRFSVGLRSARGCMVNTCQMLKVGVGVNDAITTVSEHFLDRTQILRRRCKTYDAKSGCYMRITPATHTRAAGGAARSSCT